MARRIVPTWTSVVLILAGIWSAVVPFVGSAFSAPAQPMLHMGQAAASGMNMATLGASTLTYHIIPGGITILVGLYQLTAEWLQDRLTGRATTTAPQPAKL